MNKKINIWKISTFVLVIVIVALFATSSINVGLSTGNAVAEDAIQFINTELLQGQATATLGDVSSESGVYKTEVNVQGQDADVYITKDGKLMFLSAIPLTKTTEQPTTTKDVPVEDVPKSDIPQVELFVMSHCPYGTQMEKGILPIVKLLGDKINFEVKFVYYSMHGEKEIYEELNQYCIQKEQNSKYLDYLECFLADGDGEGCLDQVEIDKTALETCTQAADTEFDVTKNFKDESSWLSGTYPMFNINKDDNEMYNVGGSPTLVINGQTVSAARDSVALLATICNAFNVAPEECNTQLESGTPSPGFGWSESGSANVASCGA